MSGRADADEALDRAMLVFWTKGYEKTSPEELIEAMGIDAGGLFGEYGSKRDLYEHALRRYMERDRARLEVGLQTGDTLAEALAALLRRFADLLVSDPLRRGCFMVDACDALTAGDERLGALLRGELFAQERILTDAFARARERGEAVADRPDADLAAYVVSAVQGLRLVGKTTRDRDRLERVIEMVLDTAFR